MDTITKSETIIKPRFYQMALGAVEVGAVNVSGLAHSLCDWIGLIEADLEEWDREVEGAIYDLRHSCQQAWAQGNMGTEAVNTHRDVVEYVTKLANFCFSTDELRRVASHPIIRLMVSQMMQLSGVTMWDEYYFERWGEAYALAKERANEN